MISVYVEGLCKAPAAVICSRAPTTHGVQRYLVGQEFNNLSISPHAPLYFYPRPFSDSLEANLWNRSFCIHTQVLPRPRVYSRLYPAPKILPGLYCSNKPNHTPEHSRSGPQSTDFSHGNACSDFCQRAGSERVWRKGGVDGKFWPWLAKVFSARKYG